MFNDEDDDEEYEVIKKLEDALSKLGGLFRWLYFDYMIRQENPNIKEFKKIYLEEVSIILIDRIHDKYADHVEGVKKQWKDDI